MTDGSGRGRVWTWVRRILLGVAAVVALLVLGKAVQLATLGWRTGREATAALEESQETGRRTMDQLSALVERDLGVPVSHSARGYTCTVDHADQGWIVDHYYQKCSWTQIDYVQVGDARLEQLVGDLGGAGSADDACPPLYPPFEDDERFRYLPVRAHPAGATGSGCGLPELIEGGGGDATRPSETVVLDAVQVDELDPEAHWISVEHSERFFLKDLGCGFTPVFCTQPMGQPAMP